MQVHAFLGIYIFWDLKLIKLKYSDQQNILIRVLKYIYSSDDAFLWIT